MTEEAKPDLNKLPDMIEQDKSFSVLDGFITKKTMKGIGEMDLKTMTDIQAKCIPEILMGNHIFATAKTGSGKTLAFLIPVLDMINQIGFKTRNGTGAIIISPTRELAIQTFEVLKQLVKFHSHTIALVVGGNDRKDEARKLFNGVNILVATPSRLLDHLTKTDGFLFNNLELLVIDEADRILQDGFEETMKEIMEITPAKKQMLLFTATRTNKTDELARSFFTRKPVYINVEDGRRATAKGLDQGYILCSPDKRFSTLFTLLREKINDSKIMVFMGARVTVQFYDKVLRHWEVNTMSIHGGHDQHERERILRKFRKVKNGALLCTDVAARGLDIKDIDWIFQYDPPTSVQEYIHRVGRTARGEGGTGSALLFLMDHELEFTKHLKAAKVPIEKYDMDWNMVPELHVHLEELINRNEFVKPWATQAYEGFVRSYKSHPLMQVFDFNKLNLNKLALSFGLSKVPWIDFSKKRKSDSNGFGSDMKRSRMEKFGKRTFNQKKKIAKH